jgi:hypothetical protein
MEIEIIINHTQGVGTPQSDRSHKLDNHVDKGTHLFDNKEISDFLNFGISKDLPY